MGLDYPHDGGIVIDQEDLRGRMRAAMETRGLAQSSAARQIGLSATVLSQWLGGKYPGDNAEVEAKLRRWLDAAARGEAAGLQRAVSPGWMRTPTAGMIWTMLTQAQHGPDIVVVASAPGLGKTLTASAYRAASPNVWIATMDPTMAGPNAVLSELAHALDMRPGSPTSLPRRIGERVEGTGGLIVIDEAQYPRKPALDMLRSLHDRYGVGVALLGNHGLFAGTAAQSRADGFAQFFSRIGARRRFEAPAEGDVEMLLDAWGVEEVDARKWLRTVAGKPGALRALDKCVKAALVLAAGADEALSARHLKAAWAINE